MNIDSWTQAFAQALSNFWGKIAIFLPNFIATLVIIFVGIFLVRMLGKLVALSLEKLGTDRFCERIGISSAIEHAGFELSPSQALSNLIKLFLILLIVLTAAETLGLNRVSSVIDQILLYVPKLAGAIIVVMGGMFAGHYLKRSVASTMAHFEVDYAKAVSQVVYTIVMLITASLAINQLEISTALFDIFFIIVFASIGLALAVSFGLGAKGISSQLISGVYLREQICPGDILKYDGQEGMVLAVGSVNTLIQIGEEVKRISNEELVRSQFSTQAFDQNE